MKEKRKKERTHSANIKAASLPASRHKPRFSFGDEGNFDDRPETRSWHNGILIGTPTLPVCLAIHQPTTHPSIHPSCKRRVACWGRNEMTANNLNAMRRAGVGEELFYYSSYFCNRSFPPQSAKPLALHIYIGRIIVDLSNPQIFVERTSLPIFRYFLSLFPVSGPQQTSHNTVKIPPPPPPSSCPLSCFPSHNK